MSKHHLPSDYAARIKALRERWGLSQNELAKHLDTTLGTERPHLQEWVDRGW